MWIDKRKNWHIINRASSLSQHVFLLLLLLILPLVVVATALSCAPHAISALMFRCLRRRPIH